MQGFSGLLSVKKNGVFVGDFERTKTLSFVLFLLLGLFRETGQLCLMLLMQLIVQFIVKMMLRLYAWGSRFLGLRLIDLRDQLFDLDAEMVTLESTSSPIFMQVIININESINKRQERVNTEQQERTLRWISNGWEGGSELGLEYVLFVLLKVPWGYFLVVNANRQSFLFFVFSLVNIQIGLKVMTHSSHVGMINEIKGLPGVTTVEQQAAIPSLSGLQAIILDVFGKEPALEMAQLMLNGDLVRADHSGVNTPITNLSIFLQRMLPGVPSLLWLHFDGSHEILLVITILLIFLRKVFGEPIELCADQSFLEMNSVCLLGDELGRNRLDVLFAHRLAVKITYRKWQPLLLIKYGSCGLIKFYACDVVLLTFRFLQRFEQNQQFKHSKNMQKSSSEVGDLISFFKQRKTFSGDPQQTKLIDTVISKHRDGKLPKEAGEMITLIQEIAQINETQLQHKPLQLLRFSTKQAEYRALLKPQFLVRLNELLPEVTNSPPILVEILALHLRFIEVCPQSFTHEMFCKIMDLLAMNNPQATKVILEITRELISRGFSKVFEEVWYVGRLVFALERLEPAHKPKLIGIIKDLLDNAQFNENFRRINGATTLITELRRAQGNFLLKMALLSCIYRLLLTTKTEVIYDFKLSNFTSLISLKLREPLDYKETIYNIKILTHLMLDNDMSSKYVEDGFEDAILLLVRSHPINCHMIKFDDIDEQDEPQAFDQFRVLLLRLLRYVCSLQKNRKIFKRIFPSELLGPFFDIGHFVKPPEAYLKTLKAFNQLESAKVEAIEDQFEKIGKIMKNKNFKLQVVGSYNLLQELGQGAFGYVFLAKKGSNQYALKRLKIEQLRRKSKEKNEEFDDYFREVKIYKELKHPNIIKFYESFVEDEYLYIVMEVVKGCNLSQLIKNQNQKGVYFQQDTVWRFLISLLSVLRYLHFDKKVIHRDLNPSNIMVDNKFNLKVTDFGLAKGISQSLQMANSFVGTLAYSCPQIVQNQPYTEKADIWSLGCIVYEIMALRAPFSGNNPLFLAKNIVNGQYTVQFPEQYSEDLKNIVRLCLLKDETKRPDSRELLKLTVDKLTVFMDELREKESLLGDEIVNMNKKINANNNFAGTARAFGTSSYNQAVGKEQVMRQTQIVKLDSDVLNKIGEDPINKFIDVVKKLSLIASTQSTMKKNFKKYVVDSFYNRVFISEDFRGHEVKAELQKLIHLSKEDIAFLGVKFELKQNHIKSITYQMLYFYIEELYELIKKA